MVEEEPGGAFIRYHEYTPTTIDYDQELGAYTVARADIYALDRRHRLTLTVVVTETQMVVHRPALEQVIGLARRVLERLVLEHQASAAALTTNAVGVYTFGGLRVR